MDQIPLSLILDKEKILGKSENIISSQSHSSCLPIKNEKHKDLAHCFCLTSVKLFNLSKSQSGSLCMRLSEVIKAINQYPIHCLK